MLRIQRVDPSLRHVTSLGCSVKFSIHIYSLLYRKAAFSGKVSCKIDMMCGLYSSNGKSANFAGMPVL